MAVAVKNPPIAGMSSPLERLPVVSLIGAAYVVVSLVIVLTGLPYLWRTLTGWTDVAGSIVLGLVMAAVATGLAVLGGRLLGANRPAGSRAGIFMGVVGFLIVLGLTRWASLWIEYWIYNNHWLGDSPTVGLGLTAAVAVVLLIGEAYLLFRPRMEAFLVGFEAQGWFTATAYKGQQGQRVRRGTILGILLIAGSGVYTMINNGFLRRMPDSLYVNVPFTGTCPVVNPGDATAPGVELLQKLPPQDKDQVQIVSPGASTFTGGAVVSAQDFRTALTKAIEAATNATAPLEKKIADEQDPQQKQNLEYELLEEAPDPQTRDLLLKEVKEKDVTALVSLPGRSLAASAALGPIGVDVVPPSGLPTALLRINPFVLRDVNARLRADYVLVTDPGLSTLKAGSVVPRKEFDAAVEQVVGEGQKEHVPIGEAPFAAATPGVVNERLTLLPALQYTLPLLLIGLALWVAWRVVNYPAFADFLIATEAELNKVSWITRPRLIQDTIVVLVTVFLMAIFLFSMDQLWRVVLSNWPINVLQINRESTDKSAEQKPW